MLGEKLKLEEEELNDIEGYVGARHEKSFKVLWSWKEANKQSGTLIEDLKKILAQMKHQDLIDELLKDAN